MCRRPDLGRVEKIVLDFELPRLNKDGAGVHTCGFEIDIHCSKGHGKLETFIMQLGLDIKKLKTCCRGYLTRTCD